MVKAPLLMPSCVSSVCSIKTICICQLFDISLFLACGGDASLSEVSPTSIVSSNQYSKLYLFCKPLLLTVSCREMTIKHSVTMYIPTVPFLCTERACVVFLWFQNSPGKIFRVKSSVASIKDQRSRIFCRLLYFSESCTHGMYII